MSLTIEQILTRQNKELREQVETLQEENRQLRDQVCSLGPLPEGMQDLTAQEEKIVRSMLGKGRVRTSAILAATVPDHVDDPNNYLKVYMNRIRKKIAKAGYAIENYPRRAYAIVPLDAATKSVA